MNKTKNKKQYQRKLEPLMIASSSLQFFKFADSKFARTPPFNK